MADLIASTFVGVRCLTSAGGVSRPVLAETSVTCSLSEGSCSVGSLKAAGAGRISGSCDGGAGEAADGDSEEVDTERRGTKTGGGQSDASVVSGLSRAAGLTGGEGAAHDFLVLVGSLGLNAGFECSSLLLRSPSFRSASIRTL